MFWADRVAGELKKRKLPLEWVDDMKTPSGRIHVGALRGVVVHDLVYRALKSAGASAKYTYVFEDHDPMDALPVYLSKEKFEKYLGFPLYKVPSPIEGFENFAKYYALEFKNVFNKIGCNPEIIWATDLYLTGRMNEVIRQALDNADIIRKIYEDLYEKEISKAWHPFQVYCPNCKKVSTTKVNNWDGKKVSFVCDIEGLAWTKGCGYKGEISPFSPNEKGDIAGKLPWKVEWSAKWKVIGATVEGAGKDHMSKGGSHDLTSQVCQEVFYYPVPYPIPYEWFLIEGRKMSTSKGIGSSALEMSEIFPPEILRFLMVKTRINQAINFDPTGDTIPKLFDEYQKAAVAYFEKTDEDLARIFELSQIGGVQNVPKIRFSALLQWVQMPNMEETIKEEGLFEWAKYAKIWLEKYVPESEKFTVKKEMPEEAKKLSKKQKEFLKKLSSVIEKAQDAEKLQAEMYNFAKELDLPTKDAFSAIYLSLIGKDHGPKAAWLIASLDKEFVKKRFKEVY